MFIKNTYVIYTRNTLEILATTVFTLITFGVNWLNKFCLQKGPGKHLLGNKDFWKKNWGKIDPSLSDKKSVELFYTRPQTVILLLDHDPDPTITSHQSYHGSQIVVLCSGAPRSTSSVLPHLSPLPLQARCFPSCNVTRPRFSNGLFSFYDI